MNEIHNISFGMELSNSVLLMCLSILDLDEKPLDLEQPDKTKVRFLAFKTTIR